MCWTLFFHRLSIFDTLERLGRRKGGICVEDSSDFSLVLVMPARFSYSVLALVYKHVTALFYNILLLKTAKKDDCSV